LRDDEPNLAERILVALFRLGGAITLCAFGALFLPTERMAAIHAALGLGEFPAAPITEYLARSVSALYGFHGALLLLVARDVRRFAPLVVYLGVMCLVFGVLLLAIDLRAGMPLAWTLAEGPPLAVTGAIVLGLARSIGAPRDPHGAGPS
jgi:hypothetical protein